MEKKKKRILIVIGSLNLGGTEKYLLTVLPRLLDDFDIDVYTTSFAGTLLKDFESAGIMVHYHNNTAQQNNFKALKFISLLANYMRAVRYMARSKYDVIHFYLPGAYLLGGFAALMTGQKNLLMSRRSQNDYQVKHPVMAKVERYLHTKMRYVLANSKKVREQLLEEGVDKNRVKLIYNGVNVSSFNLGENKTNNKEQYGIDKSDFVFTIIANLYFYKGHADLFYALSKIKNKLSNRWILLCVGRDAGEKNNLIQLAQNLGLSKHIKFLNESSYISNIISITDVGISASHEEGFSNAVLEMMAGGKPMIVTDAGGNAEAIINNKTGLVVPPKDIDALAQAILKMIHNPEMMRKYGDNAKKRAISEFSLERCVDENRLLYQEVLSA